MRLRIEISYIPWERKGSETFFRLTLPEKKVDSVSLFHM